MALSRDMLPALLQKPLIRIYKWREPSSLRQRLLTESIQDKFIEVNKPFTDYKNREMKVEKIKCLLWLILLTSQLFLNAQSDTAEGIKWLEVSNWERVKAIAKAENKYIFVDCFATWCGPCKEMDKNVYSDRKLGNYINEKFVSIKVQMDSSGNDNEYVKMWYADAQELNRKYKIQAYPTFLFFDSDARLLNMESGYRSIENFIALVKELSDFDNHYYTQLAKYKEGIKDFYTMPNLARQAIKKRQEEIANVIADDYMQNYLFRQENRAILYKKENLDFIRQFTRSSRGDGFKFFYRHSKKIDEVMDQLGYTEGLIDYIITKEQIKPALEQVNTSTEAMPDWQMLEKSIRKKYNNDYAERTILNAQLKWYRKKQEWSEVVKYQVKKVEKYGLDTAGLGKYFTNNMIWDVFFKHSNNISQLNKAVQWMEVVLKSDPYATSILDTYANLLYKCNRVEEAIKYESIAIKMDPNDIKKKNALENMRRGQPTYSNDGAVWDYNTLPRTKSTVKELEGNGLFLH